MNTISDGDKIEKLIKNARDKSLSERQKREGELERRREAALKQIASWAIKHGVVDSVLEARINEASVVRISQTEAYAVLAKQGDLTSPIMWWDIRVNEDQTLWKGYVVKLRVFRKRVDVGTHSIEVNVRAMIDDTPGWVAECYCDDGKIITVGISTESVGDSVVAALGALKSVVHSKLDKYEGLALAMQDVLQNPEGFSKAGEGELTSEEA